MKKFIVFTLALLAAGAMSARAAEAKEIWAKECAKCHGPDGKGRTTMGKKLEVKDYSDPKNQADLKDEKMAKSIKEGIKDGDKTRMKAFGDVLSDSEVKALIAYFRGLKK
jgi:mono/diheme cytochrome c family protein